MIDYSAEPRVYLDGHVCNFYCRDGEHCSVSYADVDAPVELYRHGLERTLRRVLPLRTVQRVEHAPEAPRSEQVRTTWCAPGYPGCPPTEVAYRYWFTYPAHIEAGVAT